MRPPGKKVAWVMQSYAAEVDKNLTFDPPKNLGNMLTHLREVFPATAIEIVK